MACVRVRDVGGRSSWLVERARPRKVRKRQKGKEMEKKEPSQQSRRGPVREYRR
jgi:hypothetical protein